MTAADVDRAAAVIGYASVAAVVVLLGLVVLTWWS